MRVLSSVSASSCLYTFLCSLLYLCFLPNAKRMQKVGEKYIKADFHRHSHLLKRKEQVVFQVFITTCGAHSNAFSWHLPVSRSFALRRPPRSSLWTQLRRHRHNNDRLSIKEILGTQVSCRWQWKECQWRSGGYHGAQVSEIQPAHRGRWALLLPLRRPLRRGGSHHRDRGHRCGAQLQLPRLHHLQNLPVLLSLGLFPGLQRVLGAGKWGQRSKKAKRAWRARQPGWRIRGWFVLGPNETSCGTRDLKDLLPTSSARAPRTAVGSTTWHGPEARGWPDGGRCAGPRLRKQWLLSSSMTNLTQGLF